MTDLTPILTRFTDASWDEDTLLDDLIRCPLQRLFCLHMALEEAFETHISDAEFRQIRTVGDILRSLETIDA